MPWNVRTAEQGTLGIYREPGSDDLLARWFDAHGVEQPTFSLLELLRHRFDLVGKFNHEALDLLTATAADSLLDGSILLPGFIVTDSGAAGRDEHRRDRRVEVRLAWQVPELASQSQLMAG